VRYSEREPEVLFKTEQSSTLPSEFGASMPSGHREDEILQVLDQKEFLLFLLLSLVCLHSDLR